MRSFSCSLGVFFPNFKKSSWSPAILTSNLEFGLDLAISLSSISTQAHQVYSWLACGSMSTFFRVPYSWSWYKYLMLFAFYFDLINFYL